MWMSVTGQYLSVPGLYDNAWWIGLADVGIISAVMMIIPFIWRLVNGERLEFTKGKKICKWNSIGMFVLSIIISLAVLDGSGFMGIGGLGALMFYYINKWLFVYDETYVKSIKKAKKERITEMTLADEDEEIETPTKLENKKNRFCKLCGGKIDANKKCKKCGKQYFKLNKSILIYGIVGILVISNLITLIMLLNKNREFMENCDEHDYLREIKIKRITNGKSLDYVSDKLDFYDENIVFVIEGYGDYYYTYDCMQEITDGEEFSYWAYNKEAAIAKDYRKGICD